MPALLDNYAYACISATEEVQEPSEKGSWISTHTILTFWLPVSAQVKTVISYIKSAVGREWGCSMLLH